MKCKACDGNEITSAKPDHLLVKLYNALSGARVAAVSGVFLAASLLVALTDLHTPVDPAWVAILLCGYPLFFNAVWQLLFGKGIHKITSSLLIAMAMVAAIFIGELFAAGQVALIMAVGEWLESKTISRAKKGMSRLISLAPQQGRVITHGTEALVSVEKIKQGDRLRVLPGEALPVDGEIIAGNTSVDQSVITGEALPIDKTVGDAVFCGTINMYGAIEIKATQVGEDSSLKTLIRLIRQADSQKAPIQRMADRVAVWLVPLAFLIAVVTLAATGDIVRAVTVAIVFCPCALALSTPTAIVAAIGQATKYGVIIKSGEALERMSKITAFAFDKTGTLTHGRPTVCEVVLLSEGLSEAQLVSLCASAESHSEHPLGKAIVSYAAAQSVELQAIDDFGMTPGKGIGASISGKRVLCGNNLFLQENSIVLDEAAHASLQRLQGQGKAVILVAYDGACAGILALSDTLRKDAKDVIARLSTKNTATLLLSGDNPQAAHYIARQAGIQTVFAALLPAQKTQRIIEMQQAGAQVCMIGDGVNDAPALKTANVGIAMGRLGSDLAVESADIALVSDDLSRLPYIKRLSGMTVRLIAANITISIVFNIVAIALSVMGFLNPVTGALAHNVGSVAVVLNAALLYDRRG